MAKKLQINWVDIQNEREEKMKEQPDSVPVAKSKLIYQRTDGSFIFRLVKYILFKTHFIFVLFNFVSFPFTYSPINNY